MPRRQVKISKQERTANAHERQFWSWTKITLPPASKRQIVSNLMDKLFDQGLLAADMRLNTTKTNIDTAIGRYLNTLPAPIIIFYIQRGSELRKRLRLLVAARKRFYRPKTLSPLETLPVELILTVGDFLGFEDVFRCSLVSKALMEKLYRARDARLRGYGVLPPQSAYNAYDAFNIYVHPNPVLPQCEQPLLMVIRKGWSRMLRTLINNGVNVNTVSLQGHTLLHCAITMRSDQCCRVLLDAGASTEMLDRQMGWSPLLTAMVHRSGMIGDLLGYGACLAKWEGESLQDLENFGAIQDWAVEIGLVIDDVLNTEVEEEWDIAPLPYATT